MLEKIRKKVEAKIKNGQKKMSKIENPKRVSKKPLKFRVCDENAAETQKRAIKFVMINFFIFFAEKGLGIFY